jgi:hydrogenase nickel incorporation protein HypA/HybF
MHELHLAKDILYKIKEKAKEEGKEKLSAIAVSIGQARFTHLEELKELLQEIAKGTVAEGAVIDFNIIPLKSACTECGRDFDASVLRLDCPHCGGTAIQVTTGNDLDVMLR